MFQFSKPLWDRQLLRISFYVYVLFMCGVGLTQAKVWIVDNNPTPLKGNHVLPTLQEAIDVASDGDVIQVTPSLTSYGGMNFTTKQLKIVGSGFDVSGDHTNKRSVIEGGNFSDASNVTLSGLIMNTLALSNSESVIIDHCEIKGRMSVHRAKNMVIRNCIFHTTLKIEESESVVFSNNILFSGGEILAGENVRSGTVFRNVGLMITNNLFLGMPNASGPSRFSASLADAIVSNNIFFVTFVTSENTPSVTGNTFSNNLYFSSGTDASFGNSVVGIFPTSDGNVSTNNIVDSDPQFVKGIASNVTRIDLTRQFVSPNSPNPIIFLFDLDFHLSDSSPAKTGGSDGGEIGLYGGLYPFRALEMGGGSLPVVNELVTSGVVRKGSALKVTVKGRGN